jgi:hypothetical protein
MSMKRVAIVGSRRRTDKSAVEDEVARLADGTVVVSGGAKGPDSWAAEAAHTRGLEVKVHRPRRVAVRSYGDAVRGYYARNQAIVDDCDWVIAFPAADRSGGTEDTIRRALRAGKPVHIR